MSRRKNDRADGYQADLEGYQRVLRSLEADRKVRHDAALSSNTKIQQQVENLKKDNERLKRELELETRQARMTNSSSAATQVSRMQSQSETYKRKIQTERKRIETLHQQVVTTRDSILALRKEMKGINSINENQQQIQKQIRSLENKLDKALIKLNEALAHNKGLREIIENLRRERMVFDGIYKKLEQELQDKKRDMASIIDIYNEAYRRRDEAYAEMQELKNRADEEQGKFENDWARLTILVNTDRLGQTIDEAPAEKPEIGATAANALMSGFAALDSLSSPSASSAPSDLSPTSSSSASHHVPAHSFEDGQDTHTQEVALRQRIIRQNLNNETDRAAIESSTRKVSSLKSTFEQIQRETGIANIDELVSRFIAAEDQNFSLFNYVNDLNTEIERVEESLHSITAELDKYRITPLSSTASFTAPSSSGHPSSPSSSSVALDARKKMLDDLDNKLARTEAEAVAYEDKYLEAQKIQVTLKTGIESIFAKISTALPSAVSAPAQDSQAAAADSGADSAALADAGVTESNMMQYLGMIEQKTEELLLTYLEGGFVNQGHPNPRQAAIEFLHPPTAPGKEKDKDGPEFSIPEISSKGVDSEDEDDEDDDRPLTRDELAKRALRDLPDVSKKGKGRKK